MSKPDPMSREEQRKGGPIDRMNIRREKRMAKGKGKGKDPFDPTHPSQQRAEEFKKRYGFGGERDEDQSNKVSEEEGKYYSKKAKEKSEKEINKATSLRRIDSYKHGGKVHRTGIAMLHKGERVIPKRATKHRARKR